MSWLDNIKYEDDIYVWLSKPKTIVEGEDSIKREYIEELDLYPWANCDSPVLAHLIKDYPNFIVVEIQPHMNPLSMTGLSKPYTQALSKHAIYQGRIRVKKCA